MNVLVNKIKWLQREKKLSDADLARILKIDQSTLSYIKSGKRQPGEKILKAIIREFPELSADIMNYLSTPEKVRQ